MRAAQHEKAHGTAESLDKLLRNAVSYCPSAQVTRTLPLPLTLTLTLTLTPTLTLTLTPTPTLTLTLTLTRCSGSWAPRRSGSRAT